ncbi:MAG: methylenetetrahydrofolate reductase [Treponema sp.]|nr:methylenetetrahydrofolate reductase [Treponema sp.]
MAITRVLDALSGGKKRFSLEVIPPLRGGDMDAIMHAVEATMPWQPAFVSVTDHARSQASLDCEGESTIVPRPRPGTLGTSVAIRDRFGITTVPHLVAFGAERLAMEDLLIDLHWSGFHDLFVVRGDDGRPPATARPDASRVDATRSDAGRAEAAACVDSPPPSYPGAVDLLRHIGDLNAGRYSPPVQGTQTSFVVGVAGYPEKHVAAPSFEADMDSLAEKLRAGASFIISQMVFDAGHYRRFVEELRRRGFSTPVIPGLKPILRHSSLALIPASFFVDIPLPLAKAMEEARSPSEERRIGTEWAVRIAHDLLDAGAPCIQYFTMGRGDALKDILKATFG